MRSVVTSAVSHSYPDSPEPSLSFLATQQTNLMPAKLFLVFSLSGQHLSNVSMLTQNQLVICSNPFLHSQSSDPCLCTLVLFTQILFSFICFGTNSFVCFFKGKITHQFLNSVWSFSAFTNTVTHLVSFNALGLPLLLTSGKSSRIPLAQMSLYSICQIQHFEDPSSAKH